MALPSVPVTKHAYLFRLILYRHYYNQYAFNKLSSILIMCKCVNKRHNSVKILTYREFLKVRNLRLQPLPSPRAYAATRRR